MTLISNSLNVLMTTLLVVIAFLAFSERDKPETDYTIVDEVKPQLKKVK